MNRSLAAITAAAAAALALAGCASGSSTGTAPASQAASPADPVAILRATGATPDPGTVYGSHDVYGDRMASGSFRGGESVTIYTMATPDDFAREQSINSGPDDQHGMVTIPGKLTVILMTAGYNATADANVWAVTPQQVSVRVHGLYIAPQH